MTDLSSEPEPRTQARLRFEPPSLDALLALHGEPLLAAARARARRDALRGRTIRISASAPGEPPAYARRERAGALPLDHIAWPHADAFVAGDRWVLQIDADDDARARFAAWALATGAHELPSIAIAPCSRTAAGLHRLWCIAVLRLAMPPQVMIEARHDLLGIRLAQIALGFGADVLAGPIAPDRSLPLCGVTRPDEATRAGLTTLVRHAGLTAIHDEEPTP
jgi:hypothetical protein